MTMLMEFLGLIFVTPWTALVMFFDPPRFKDNHALLFIAYLCILVCYLPGMVMMFVYVVGLCVMRAGRALVARIAAKSEKPAP
jgi:hypothetical protein